MYSIRKKDKKIIESDWRDFKKAVERNDILYISKIGTQLVWNKSMTVKRLKIMSKELEKFPTNIEEIEKLRLLIFNKKLHWERKSV
ncbi:hypothetical protein [Aureivirga sp. CE67]|uniref:hypothetical protein n=1 Tax=Aureivirga sp. CE67 TaxID=1788983 RepID=UPI001E62EF30|nr:hypothetical protein [Aureivirga sp. CE67]